ncbi:MAG: hypothetical protein VCD00_18685 [Candidatus Hydrogenedentota bacterium]
MSTSNENPSTILRGALKGNGAFSSVTGIALLVAAKPIAGYIGLEFPWLLTVIGVSLLIFAVGLFRNATREKVDLTEARIAVVLDSAWVLGSGVLLMTGMLNTTGNWSVAIIADIVLVFAIAQSVGVRRMRTVGRVA